MSALSSPVSSPDIAQSFSSSIANSTPACLLHNIKVGRIHLQSKHGSNLSHCPAWHNRSESAHMRKRVVASDGISTGVSKASGSGTESTITEPVVENSDESSQKKSTSNKCVLVVGATGGVGQLVVAALMDRGFQVRALLRDVGKARALFGEENMGRLQVYVGDTRSMTKVDPSVFEGITHVICCTGTTAFPSRRWYGENTPENTDWHGVRNLIAALPRTVERFVLVSSIGVTKYDRLPWNIMNLFGVLKFKKMGEDYLRQSGLLYTIIRPGRLTDGPYTSYDLNTLLKATAGTRRSVLIGQGDQLVGEASRIIIAEACIQALDFECACGQIYEVNSIEGDGPGKDPKRWEVLFKTAQKICT